MSVAKFPISILSWRMSSSNHVRAGPGSTRSDVLKYSRHSPPESPASLPPNPPNQKFIDMLRTRGFCTPFTMTKERSAGHFQIAVDFPQYGHSGLFIISIVGSQVDRLFGSKSIKPFT